ncbi:hypothetical protein [Acinetobacter soli]|uniref:hypothetical protein n=2 Tax=Acinetobacter soli TaxID=487316 RepID=UPI001230645B|nr:hypothetical protein [Acinetobacter soli]
MKSTINSFFNLKSYHNMFICISKKNFTLLQVEHLNDDKYLPVKFDNEASALFFESDNLKFYIIDINDSNQINFSYHLNNSKLKFKATDKDRIAIIKNSDYLSARQTNLTPLFNFKNKLDLWEIFKLI